MKRSISLPVKTPEADEPRHLQRSEEKDQLFHEDEEDENSDNFSFLEHFKHIKFREEDSIKEEDEDSQQINPLQLQRKDQEQRFQEIVLPIELNIRPSEEGIRRRRNSLYQSRVPCGPKRIFEKTGKRNVNFSKIPDRSWRYFQDFVTTLIEQKWRYTFTWFSISYFLSWFVFTILIYLIGYTHGDLTFHEETGERMGDGNLPCIINAKDFTGYFTYTVETQVSIGYGEKYPSEECPEAVFLLVAQIIIGIAIEGAMVGIVYTKLSRPGKRIAKLKFSKKAVICLRDGKLCLMFRVCDPSEQQAIGTKVRAFLYQDKVTLEGEILGKTHKQLNLEDDGIAFMMWPIIVCHVIDETSPLYECTPKELAQKNFEIAVSLTGSSPSTGQFTEARTSYLPREIFWGQRFVNIIHYDWSKKTYIINYDNFHSTILVQTPLCSAKAMATIARHTRGQGALYNATL